MAEVLHEYREVALPLKAREEGIDSADELMAVLSYDEKPGIQAIGNTAPHLPPVPGSHVMHARDNRYKGYKRHGTLSLLCGIDFFTGELISRVEDRHRSREFAAGLKDADVHYPEDWKIRVILDNHNQGSWLNVIGVFFSKLASTLLRGIRVGSNRSSRNTSRHTSPASTKHLSCFAGRTAPRRSCD